MRRFGSMKTPQAVQSVMVRSKTAATVRTCFFPPTKDMLIGRRKPATINAEGAEFHAEGAERTSSALLCEIPLPPLRFENSLHNDLHKLDNSTDHKERGKYSRQRRSTSFAMSSRTTNSSGRLGFLRASITMGPRYERW